MTKKLYTLIPDANSGTPKTLIMLHDLLQNDPEFLNWTPITTYPKHYNQNGGSDILGTFTHGDNTIGISSDGDCPVAQQALHDLVALNCTIILCVAHSESSGGVKYNDAMAIAEANNYNLRPILRGKRTQSEIMKLLKALISEPSEKLMNLLR